MAVKIKGILNPSNQILFDRYSIRKYDETTKISREELANIIQDAMTAPSSLNLQPWHFVVIDSEEGKKLIEPYMMFNQQQCRTSSAVIAIYGDLECVKSADKIYTTAVENRLISQEAKDKMLEMIHSYMTTYTPERLSNAIMLDCGFVTMQIMISAKNYGYDTNPIGGYQRKEMTEALGFDTKRYLPVILLSIGKADENPKDTIRYTASEVIQWK